MPIQFTCENCKKTLKVRDELAGKRIKCPQCQSVVAVPAGAQADAWYLQTEDGETYGPVPRSELDSWAKEGRVTAGCQVLREGDEQWQWATDVYPQLAGAATADAQPSPQPQPSNAPASAQSTSSKPASGGFDFAAPGVAAPQQSGPLDFAPSETEASPSTPAFDFGGDAGRGGRGRSGKATKSKASSSSIASSPAAASTSSVDLSEQPGYPAGAQPSHSSKSRKHGRMQRLTKVGVLSLGKFMGGVGVFTGLIFGVLYGGMIMLMGALGAASGVEGAGAMGAMGIGAGLAVILLAPIFYGVFGFVGGLIYALVINFILGFTGGLEIEIQ